MASTILIVAKKSNSFFEQFEAALLKRSYPLLTLRNPTTVLERLQSEPFAAIVVDVESIPGPESLVNQLFHHPLGAVTPVVLLEPPCSSKKKRDLFSGKKTILDQAFRANDITPDSLADYLLETVHAARE